MVRESELTRPVLQALNESLLGELSTTELRMELKRRIKLDQLDLAPLRNRSDTRIDQKIRNIKCHRKQEQSPFSQGYIEEIPRGFRITEKGRKYLTSANQGIAPR